MHQNLLAAPLDYNALLVNYIQIPDDKAYLAADLT